MSDLLIKNARPMGEATADILIRNGRIAAIGAGIEVEGVVTEDAGGAIAIAGMLAGFWLG